MFTSVLAGRFVGSSLGMSNACLFYTKYLMTQRYPICVRDLGYSIAGVLTLTNTIIISALPSALLLYVLG